MRARRPPLILAYHALGSVARELDPANLVLPPAALRVHVQVLRARGYECVSMAEFARRLGGRRPPAGLCALTFDDGTADQAVLLPPLLAELGVPATVYVCPGLLGEPYPFTEPGAGVRFMTRGELGALAARPEVELGSHTERHTVLAGASRAEAEAEMAASKRALEALAGAPVVSFAYPECGYSRACPEAARAAGYTSAVTCGGRGSWSPYELKRVSLDPLDGRLTWALKSRGLWDPVRRSPPGRLARALARPLRHGRAGG